MSSGGSTLGEVLRRARTLAGLSQDELATRSGVSVRAISDLERGVRRMPHPATLRLLAAALALDESALTVFSNRSGLESVRISNLPAEVSSLVGREADVLAVRSLVLRTRLVTLVGPGGVGKTRLALAVAQSLVPEFPLTTVVWLANVTEEAGVAEAIALALPMPTVGRPLWEIVAQQLGGGALLVLDNLEHVIDAAPLVTELLRTADGLHVLATSRQQLRLQGEHVYAVAPLSTPATHTATDPAEALRESAVALFVQRARAAAPDFTLGSPNVQAVVELCRRLDGLPLALELAAAHIGALPPELMLRHIDRRLDLLTSPHQAEPRHRTLRATLDWSCELLSEGEQVTLRRLAVFSETCSLGAAEYVCGWGMLDASNVLEHIARLVEKSLVLVLHAPDRVRYKLLETVRDYASEALVLAGEEAATRTRHRDWCIDLVGKPPHPRFKGAREIEMLHSIGLEMANVRAALDWSLSDSGRVHDAAAGLRLASGLITWWERPAYLAEGRQWLDALLQQADMPTVDRIDGLVTAAALAYLQGDFATAARLQAEGLALAQQLAEPLQIAGLLALGASVLVVRGEATAAKAVLHEALRMAGPVPGPFAQTTADIARFWLGLIATAEGNHDEARRWLEVALASHVAIGNWLGEAYTRAALGALQLAAGDGGAAAQLVRASLRLFERMGDVYGIGVCLTLLGWCAALQGAPRRAARLLAAEEALREQTGLAPAVAPVWGALRHHALAAIRQHLEGAELAIAWQVGRDAPLESVVQEELQDDSDHLGQSPTSIELSIAIDTS